MFTVDLFHHCQPLVPVQVGQDVCGGFRERSTDAGDRLFNDIRPDQDDIAARGALVKGQVLFGRDFVSRFAGKQDFSGRG